MAGDVRRVVLAVFLDAIHDLGDRVQVVGSDVPIVQVLHQSIGTAVETPLGCGWIHGQAVGDRAAAGTQMHVHVQYLVELRGVLHDHLESGFDIGVGVYNAVDDEVKLVGKRGLQLLENLIPDGVG